MFVVLVQVENVQFGCLLCRQLLTRYWRCGSHQDTTYAWFFQCLI